MTTDIEKTETIPFHGSELIARRGADDDYYVALKPLCEGMGIDYTAQYRRLNRQPWAVTAMMATTGADGKTYQMFGINRKTLTMWLATIDTSRLKDDEVRGNIVTYQRECAEALDSYFHDGAAVRELPGDTDDDLIARALLAAQRKIEERDRRLAKAEHEVRQLACEVDSQSKTISQQRPYAALGRSFVSADGTMTIRDASRNFAELDKTMTMTRVFQLLRDNGYLEKHSNKPTVKATQPGYLRQVVPTQKHAKPYAVFTAKGAGWFIQRFIYQPSTGIQFDLAY